jgi:hypothetical protein
MPQTICLADALMISPEWCAQFHVLLTDPPYSPHVHGSAVSQSKGRGARKREFGFASLTPRLRRAVGMACANVRRWGVVYSDVEHSSYMRISAEAAGAEYIRTLPWVRWSMPQLSGDRPAQGFEHVAIFYGTRSGRKHWNGPGNLTALLHNCLRGESKHKAEKPLDQCLDLVSWFSDPEENVLDLFAGSGAIGQACRLLNRNYFGLELDPEWVEKGNMRLLSPQLSDSDFIRVNRWLESTDYEPAAQGEGPTAERTARRLADKQRVRVALGLAA